MLVFYAGYSAAEEHPACLDLPLDDPGYTSAELHLIAASCSSPLVADLYFNRALHIDLLNKYRDFEQALLQFGKADDDSYIEYYRMHIALVEAFSSRDLLNEKRDQTLSKLNRIYEQSHEIAELRFKGYDLVADRLELIYQL
ncbi:hypothetical protein A3195_00425 [Candidatus Thiodiazotropha endoloripes]|uniref:Uncharacterized protein n=2 Tax=Candidatus Thiodiazotropha endoloripes TaxID=1818881 RepID=A0A1E2UQG0_9GAMM|nr:hypothetical protein A3193_01630 [Candidatus Thiodiazotropha endoloripes]ODB90013.1 hypothetical protein A3195_00425 [Candidatus Thiodiazotropha endoloripes]ODB92278.1 hypothetical protein A3194_07745 [Candidatus Thiodiazotropha endoloripes]ODB96724.1 hypothetical protein A3196_08130 [Candidatus Thiodiazotropha endoloripes]